MVDMAQLEYALVREGEEKILRFNYELYSRVPIIEDDPIVMGNMIDTIAEVGFVSRIVLFQKRDFEYDYGQTQLLVEIAALLRKFIKEKYLELFRAVLDDKCIARRLADFQQIFHDQLKTDPIGAYVTLKRIAREDKLRAEVLADTRCAASHERYTQLLDNVLAQMESTHLVRGAEQYIAGYKVGERDIYRRFFSPTVKPDFLFSRLQAQYPVNGIEVDAYLVEDTEITIFAFPDSVVNLYHVIPPEFRLSEDEYELLDTARTVMAEHKPSKEEFIDPERLREVFYNVGRDLIEELATSKQLQLAEEKIKKLAEILVRYTVGFGLVEVLLEDDKIQDISINSPQGQITIFVVHNDYGECVTNIIPTRIDTESWASKLRLVSGRPLDEANPILDTEIILPAARARVSVITNPLNPTGLAYSFRRHRDDPWTLPLFMKAKMLNPLAAGLISFLVDGTRTVLVTGTRSSGKTSLLGSLLVEIMQKYRIITIEDSVTGDSEILIRRNGEIEYTPIGTLIDSMINRYGTWYPLYERDVLGNPEHIEILSMDKKGKIQFAKVSKFIRHKVDKQLYKITTKSGRTITVTEDHSLFTLGDDGEIKEIKSSDITTETYIATPRILPVPGKEKKILDLFHYLNRIKEGFISGRTLIPILQKHKEKIIALAKEYGFSKSTPHRWIRLGLISIDILRVIMKQEHITMPPSNTLRFKLKGNSRGIQCQFPMSDEIFRCIGLWLGDGCYDTNSVLISTGSPQERNVVQALAVQFGRTVKQHSDGWTAMIHSKELKFLFQEILQLHGNSYTKRMPSWIYGCSTRQKALVLSGLFSADGCPNVKEISMSLASLGLLCDVQTLLLSFGIIHRIGSMHKDKTYNSRISTLRDWKLFKEYISFIPHYKQARLEKLCTKTSTHDKTDIIPLSKEMKKVIVKTSLMQRYGDYITRNNNIGRNKLQTIVQQTQLLSPLKSIVESDLYWDKVVKIELIPKQDIYVYDISVPECESFVCNNIVAHNTLELPSDALRKMGYNIQSMKVAGALAKAGAEVTATDGIRATLRLGDSALFIGEVRSQEAISLYEAMRVGAAANVVAGTIHAESPYGVYDRVVNDIGVPKTSFKATDIIIVANPIRLHGGLSRTRRVLSITEIRKHWEEDPLLEGGFVDLMKYNVETDQLEPTSDLLNGDSEVLKTIAANIRGLAGDWDAVWDNILLRAKVKETLVKYSEKHNMNMLLEARFSIEANNMFHNLMKKVQDEVGRLDSERIFFEWEEWLKRAIRKQQLGERNA